MNTELRGIILKGVGGLYSVRVTDPESDICGEVVKCRARGAFRHNNITPLAGDRVLLLPDDVAMTEEQKDFFTIRYSWAIAASDWYSKRKGIDCWAWSGGTQSKGYGDSKGRKKGHGKLQTRVSGIIHRE